MSKLDWIVGATVQIKVPLPNSFGCPPCQQRGARGIITQSQVQLKQYNDPNTRVEITFDDCRIKPCSNWIKYGHCVSGNVTEKENTHDVDYYLGVVSPPLQEVIPGSRFAKLQVE